MIVVNTEEPDNGISKENKEKKKRISFKADLEEWRSLADLDLQLIRNHVQPEMIDHNWQNDRSNSMLMQDEDLKSIGAPRTQKWLASKLEKIRRRRRQKDEKKSM
mmetsp:Transcript_42236/g.68066  ORF Transcript_42236/g.68066 Transcript_42236/m.68066 type:complete len:105 (-) Transcript_42236:314-628(-)